VTSWTPAGNRPLRVGLAGLGSMGRNHLRVLSGRDDLRVTAVADPVLQWGPLRVQTHDHRVFVGDTEVVLTATEFRLLAALLGSPGRILGRTDLANAAYPDRRSVSERTVDSHVRRIRGKLRAFDIDPFETVHGVGFRLGAAP